MGNYEGGPLEDLEAMADAAVMARLVGMVEEERGNWSDDTIVDVVEAIGRHAPERVAGIVVRLIEWKPNDDLALRLAGLSDPRDREIPQLLQPLIDSGNWAKQKRAAEILARNRTEEAGEAARQWLEREEDETLRRVLLKAWPGE